jgi:hypothetical protein
MALLLSSAEPSKGANFHLLARKVQVFFAAPVPFAKLQLEASLKVFCNQIFIKH